MLPFVLLLAVPVAAADPGGVTASLSNNALNYLVGELLPFLSKKIGTITIPDISGNQDDINYHLSAIACQSFNFGTGAVSFAPPTDLSLQLSGISVACAANWHFELASWPHFPSGSGSLDAAVSKTSASATVRLAEAALRPTLDCLNAQLSIGSIDISFHGDNALDWLLNLFKSLIGNAVSGALDKAFGPTISAFITEDGNKFLASIPIAVPITARPPYNISEARFGFVAPPAVQPTLFEIAVQGDVVPLGFSGVPPVAPPTIPPFNSTSSYMVEGRFSPYTLLAAAWTYTSADLLQWSVPSAEIPLGLNSTSGYALIAPGLSKAYPGGASVSLFLSVGEAAPLSLSMQPLENGGVRANATLELDFLVGPSKALAFSLLADTSLSLGVTVQPDPQHPGSLVFAGTLAYLHSTLTLANSTVGAVSVGLLQGLVDLVLVRFFYLAPPPLFFKWGGRGHLLPSARTFLLTNALLPPPPPLCSP